MHGRLHKSFPCRLYRVSFRTWWLVCNSISTWWMDCRLWLSCDRTCTSWCFRSWLGNLLSDEQDASWPNLLHSVSVVEHARWNYSLFWRRTSCGLRSHWIPSEIAASTRTRVALWNGSRVPRLCWTVWRDGLGGLDWMAKHERVWIIAWKSDHKTEQVWIMVWWSAMANVNLKLNK